MPEETYFLTEEEECASDCYPQELASITGAVQEEEEEDEEE